MKWFALTHSVVYSQHSNDQRKIYAFIQHSFMAKQPQFGYSKMPPSESNLESLLLHSNSCMVLLYTAVSLEVMNVGWMMQSPDPFTCKSD